ncbi:MAG: hypothetical protein ISR65_01530 [Bacteriovoracaceae bacterium]|nr:hypothetical protein [Bacteriovoracaceae bacterium]
MSKYLKTNIKYILVITITLLLTGTYNSICFAQNEYKQKRKLLAKQIEDLHEAVNDNIFDQQSKWQIKNRQERARSMQRIIAKQKINQEIPKLWRVQSRVLSIRSTIRDAGSHSITAIPILKQDVKNLTSFLSDVKKSIADVKKYRLTIEKLTEEAEQLRSEKERQAKEDQKRASEVQQKINTTRQANKNLKTQLPLISEELKSLRGKSKLLVETITALTNKGKVLSEQATTIKSDLNTQTTANKALKEKTEQLLADGRSNGYISKEVEDKWSKMANLEISVTDTGDNEDILEFVSFRSNIYNTLEQREATLGELLALYLSGYDGIIIEFDHSKRIDLTIKKPEVFSIKSTAKQRPTSRSSNRFGILIKKLRAQIEKLLRKIRLASYELRSSIIKLYGAKNKLHHKENACSRSFDNAVRVRNTLYTRKQTLKSHNSKMLKFLKLNLQYMDLSHEFEVKNMEFEKKISSLTTRTQQLEQQFQDLQSDMKKQLSMHSELQLIQSQILESKAIYVEVKTFREDLSKYSENVNHKFHSLTYKARFTFNDFSNGDAEVLNILTESYNQMSTIRVKNSRYFEIKLAQVGIEARQVFKADMESHMASALSQMAHYLNESLFDSFALTLKALHESHNFQEGFLHSIVQNLSLMGLDIEKGESTSYKIGSALGDVTSLLISVSEIVLGLSIKGGGGISGGFISLSSAGALAPIGMPLSATSILTGAAMATHGFEGLSNSTDSIMDKLSTEQNLKNVKADKKIADSAQKLGMRKADDIAAFAKTSKKISKKQLRHIKGNSRYRGGGYLDNVESAQKVLDGYKGGNAKFLGKTREGHVVVKFDGVTGTNVNPGAGFPNQPTNVFIIKGTAKPSVVPTSPTWKP